jgi:DNA-binding LytR/AlgR family response regulator
MQVNCLIVDDDPIIRATVREYAERSGFFANVLDTESPFDALKIVPQENVDLLLLDIEMPEMDGLELLGALNPAPLTVLITSRDDKALDAYEHGVVDYLVKPIRYPRFFTALQRAQSYWEARKTAPEPISEPTDNQSFFIKSNGQFVRVRLPEVLYLEALADYVVFYLQNGQQYIVLSTMKTVAEKLPPNFMRVHRSYIVNLDNIDAVEDAEILIGKRRVTVGNTHRADLMNRLKMF